MEMEMEQFSWTMYCVAELSPLCSTVTLTPLVNTTVTILKMLE